MEKVVIVSLNWIRPVYREVGGCGGGVEGQSVRSDEM